jgi:hypothetical protein
MYCITNWFIPSIFLLCTLVPLLWWFQQVWILYIHSCIESSSTIFMFFTSFFYPPSVVCNFPLLWLIFHSRPSLFKCLFIFQWDFCLGIIPVHALCLSQCNPLHCTSSPFPPILCCLTVFPCVLLLHRCDAFIIIHCLSSLGLLYQSHFWVHVLYIFVCIYNITCICIGPVYHIWEKTYSLWLSEPG